MSNSSLITDHSSPDRISEADVQITSIQL